MDRGQADAHVRRLLGRFAKAADRIAATYEERARLLGVDRQTLHNWAREDRRPPSHYHVVVNATKSIEEIEALTPDEAALFRVSRKERDRYLVKLLQRLHK